MKAKLQEGWEQLGRKSKPWMVPAAAGVGVVVLGALLVPSLASAKSKPKAHGRTPGDANVDSLHGAHYVGAYLERAQQVSRIPDLVVFGLATSKRESGWNNLAVNDSPSEAAASCKAWKRNRTQALKDTPYSADRYWCWGTGGWFGQMPANALARSPFQKLNPIWAVHDPATSTAMFTAFVARMIRDYFPDLPPEHRNWLSIRRAMASLGTMRDYDEKNERAKGVRIRFAENLTQIGKDPNFMYKRPTLKGYPGNAEVWAALRDLDPTSPPMA